ncbi:MAG: thiamine pyrophosphate-dependent dehydrogenase E1 component subunit alpha [Dehalococcoidia bacterium]
MEIAHETLVDIVTGMLRIREFEEAGGRLMEQGKIPGALHLYVGEEAVAVGVCANLNVDDFITSTHRGHGHLIAKGGDFKHMYAELFGKASGYCRGKGGSMHIADLDLGMLGANGIVGGGPPVAVGAAWTAARRGRGQVAVCFFGDGASNEGSFHEAANMAALWKLPLLFVCENNLWGEYTRQDRHQAITDVADRASGYGMPGIVVDGMDAIAVYEAASAAVARARRGDGPTMLECKTYRYYDHVGISETSQYRAADEVSYWRGRDPITILEDRLIELHVLSSTDAEALRARIRGDIAQAIQFAEGSAAPDPRELLTDVYS